MDAVNAKPRIRVLVPYFGPWPFWMPAFLASCARNPLVSWHLFGDYPIGCALPANVSLEQTSFADYCERVSQRLGIRFAPDDPYKLCDLKPALADVHRELLADCDFWAFSDIDLVYGDLLGYFGELLTQWDVISTHRTRISGHFCLMRNAEPTISAYRRVSGWRAALEHAEHVFFDESAFSHRLMPHKRWPRWLRVSVYAQDRLIRRSRFQEDYTTPKAGGRHPWLLGVEPLPTQWFWRDGRVTSNLTAQRPFPYFHFLEWKAGWRRDAAARWQLDGADLQRGWCMTREGFFALGAPQAQLDLAPPSASFGRLSAQ